MSKAKNISMLLNILMIIIGMICLTYASVPLYKLFCQVTGFGGTIQKTLEISSKIGTRKMKVYFDSNVDSALPWKFYHEQNFTEVIVGENALVYYHAKNLSPKDTKAMAVYNVTPHRAGKYFHKVKCFCFEEQILKAGNQIDFPVLFYIDPKIEEDPNMKDVRNITLSYTFYNIEEK